jgi:hypothetical protein
MLVRILVIGLLANAAVAGQVTYTASASAPMSNSPPGHLNATLVTQIPKFDRSLGRLTGIELFGQGAMLGTISVENQSSSPYYCDYGLAIHFGNFGSSGDYGWGLPAFDGTLDYGGTSGMVMDLSTWSNLSSLCLSFPTQPAPGSPSCLPITIDVSNSPPMADLYSGPGTFARTDFALLYGHLTGAGPVGWGGCDPVNLNFVYAVQAVATWTVTYTYDDGPARFCIFDVDPQQSFGVPVCPCAPSNAGCPNSQNPQGADLVSVGNPSLTADTFGLVAFGMTASTSCLFFQGSAVTYSGASFGDGRRCVAGVVRRLGTKHASGGSAGYPGTTDPPLHVIGQIAQAGTFAAYQVWYRDSAAYCTPEAFNLTSALSTVWKP